MTDVQLRRVVRERRKRRDAINKELSLTATPSSAWLRPFAAKEEPPWPDPKPPNDKDRGSAATDNPDEYVLRVPRNDYCQRFVDTGERPQNFIRDTSLLDRFEEYPKLKELTKLKDERVKTRAYPPLGVRANLRNFDLRSLECKFDVILINAPLEEYVRRSPHLAGMAKPGEDVCWSFDDIGALPIDEIAGNPSFVFLWVGDAEGLDKGRAIFSKWGFRRCEDITWVKTNRNGVQHYLHDHRSVLQHTKEHCLMGMKGTAKRSTDGHLIHCNVDTDVIIAEEPPDGSTAKPEELYYLIERFALGRRRLQLFGSDENLRPGWVTVGTGVSTTNYDPAEYRDLFKGQDGHLLGSTAEIEQLRPKSPPPKAGGPR